MPETSEQWPADFNRLVFVWLLEEVYEKLPYPTLQWNVYAMHQALPSCALPSTADHSCCHTSGWPAHVPGACR